MQQSRKTLQLPFILIVCGGVFFFANNHMLTIVIPLYLDSLKASIALIGYSSAAMGAVAFSFRFVCPYLFKKIRLNKILFFSHLLLCLITLSFLFADHPLQVFLIRALYGIPLAMFPLYYLLLIRKLSTNAQQLISYASIGGFAMPVSLAVSPFIAEYISTQCSFQAAYTAALLVSVLSFLCMFTGSLLIHKASNPILEPLQYQSVLQEGAGNKRTTLVPIICYVYLGVVDSIVLSFLPLYALSITGSFSFYFLIFSTTMVISQTFLRRFNILRHSRTLLRLGYCSLMLTLLVIVSPMGSASLILSAFFFGLGFSLVETTTNSVIISTIQSEADSSLINYQQISISIGRTLSPFLFGLAAATFGYTSSFIGSGVLGLFIILALSRYNARKCDP